MKRERSFSENTGGTGLTPGRLSVSCWGEALEQIGECGIKVKITGSGSISLGKALNIDFVQEVVAVASALQFIAPQTDVAIELGGEDAKASPSPP